MEEFKDSFPEKIHREIKKIEKILESFPNIVQKEVTSIKPLFSNFNHRINHVEEVIR